MDIDHLLFDEVEAPLITVMNGKIEEKAKEGDIVCIANIDEYRIREWIAINHIKPFVFSSEDVLYDFIESMTLAKDSMGGFILADIMVALSSDENSIRLIYEYGEDGCVSKINGICGFLDMKTAETAETSRKIQRISKLGWKSGATIIINDENLKYEKWFYCSN